MSGAPLFTLVIFMKVNNIYNMFVLNLVLFFNLLVSERSERDTLRSVQLRIADIYYNIYIVRAIFFLIIRKEGGA